MEVTPAGVGDTTVDGGDDLLGEHHCQRVAQHLDWWEPKVHDAWQVNGLGCWPDGIAEVHVHSDCQPRSTE